MRPARLLPLALVAAFAAAAPAQSPKAKPGPARPKLMSELPAPKAGEKLAVDRADLTTRAVEGGEVEVTAAAAGEERALTIPSTNWQLDVDGWFDAEGFNVAKVYPRSGLWAMRTTTGPRPLPGATNPVTGAPISTLTYRAGPGDVITHVDGVAVTSYPRLVYAVNAAADKRELAVVVMDGTTGKRHRYYVTAYKLTP